MLGVALLNARLCLVREGLERVVIILDSCCSYSFVTIPQLVGRSHFLCIYILVYIFCGVLCRLSGAHKGLLRLSIFSSFRDCDLKGGFRVDVSGYCDLCSNSNNDMMRG